MKDVCLGSGADGQDSHVGFRRVRSRPGADPEAAPAAAPAFRTKEAFIGTGVAIAVLIDLSRLGVYATQSWREAHALDTPLLLGAVLSAFAGAWLGNRFLKKLTMDHVQRLVAVLLFAVGLELVFGVV